MPKKKTVPIREIRNRAQQVAEAAELNSICLIESECYQKRQQGPLPTNLNVTIGLHSEFNEESGRLVVLTDFNLTAQYGTPDDAGVPLRVRAKFRLDYSVPVGTADNETVLAFSQATGSFHAWPYWREFVQSMTTRMGMPALVVPLFSLSQVALVQDKAKPKRKKSPKKRRKAK